MLDEDGHVLRNAADPAPGQAAEIRFCDGARRAVFDGEASGEKPKPRKKARADEAAPKTPPKQDSLFD